MPCLTVSHAEGRGATGPGQRGGGGEWARRWMEVVQEDREGEPVERRRRPQSSSNQTAAVRQPQETSWSQTLRTLRTLRTLPHRRGWCTLAAVGAVWSVCQVEAPLHPSLPPVDVCWRLLWVCVLWVAVGVCVLALRCCLRPGQNQGETPLGTQEEVITEIRNNLHAWTPPSRGHVVPVALVLADSLLLCVLQEPLLDPSVPHIKTLLSRLESVSHSLRKADVGSEATPEEPDRRSTLTDKVKLIRSYLQERMSSLDRLVQVQGDFEASVKDMLEGLAGLWAQLEELHTRVTLTKEGSRGLRDLDLASAQADAEALLTVLGRYKNRLQCCQAYLKDSTQLLQELTWSHAHMSHSVSGGGGGAESVWPELLLQSNIEQFDKVQESFLSVEQQTSTFQAHLQGLGKGDQEGPLALGAGSRSVSPQTPPHLDSRRTSDASLENSTSASVSVSSADADVEAETETPLSLCERSALSFSSTIGRLRKSGRRK